MSRWLRHPLVIAVFAAALLLGAAMTWRWVRDNRRSELKAARENVPWVRPTKTGKYNPGAVPESDKTLQSAP
ncbi:MAG: hypothetical protein KIT09_11505 [Bryobacteraceae bacterium]|nr:hypothetical protein [Bryobacteraceae bacterium]